MNTEDLIQGSESWNRARLGRLTGSNYGIVMVNTTKKREELGLMSAGAESHVLKCVGELLTGELEPELTGRAIEWGKQWEPVARNDYEAKKEQEDFAFMVEERGLILHPDNDMVGVSLDGECSDDGTLEIKCPFNSANHLKYMTDTDYIEKEHKAQMQGGLWVTGRKHCDFVSFDPRFPEGLKLYIKRFERDEEYIEKLDKRANQFTEKVLAMMAILGV